MIKYGVMFIGWFICLAYFKVFFVCDDCTVKSQEKDSLARALPVSLSARREVKKRREMYTRS